MPRQDEPEPIIDEPIVDTPEQSTEVQAETTPETQATAAPEQQSWHARLGDDYAGLSEDAALERLRHERAELQRVSNENSAYQAMLWQQRQQQAQAQRAQAQPKAEKPKWEAPEFNPEWLDLVTRDANGNLVAKPGAMPDLPAKVTAWAKHRDQLLNRLATDPDGFLAERFEASLQDKISGLIQENVASYHRTMAVNNFEAQNRDILYDQNALQRGQVQFSPAGLRIMQHVQYAMGHGFTHIDALNYGLEKFHYDLMLSGELNKPQQPQAPAPAQTPAATNAAKKEEFLRNGAKRQPSRSGAIPNSETNGAPRSRFDFKAHALAGLEAAGIDRHTQVT